jgi:hypothetical protein
MILIVIDNHESRLVVNGGSVGVPTLFYALHFMSDVDETAKLWKVNRTIHELVRDRVSHVGIPIQSNSYHRVQYRASWCPTMKSTWTYRHSG